MITTIDPRRFGGVARVYGEEGARRLAAAHVVVVGLGGVGSWAAEAVVRSGVGRVTLIDGDAVALSNTNRQLPALDGNYGRPKAEVLRERFLLINPECCIRTVVDFVTEENAEAILPRDADWALDCIDDLRGKTALVVAASRMGIPIVVSGGAGGKREPGRIVVEDLARVKGDPLAAKLRANLRKRFGFPAGSPAAGKPAKKFGIPAVVSDEPVRQPDAENAAAAGAEPGARIGFGAAMVVTATAGLRAASVAIDAIAEGRSGRGRDA